MTYWPPASLAEILHMIEVAILAAGLLLAGGAYAAWRGQLLVQTVRQNQSIFVHLGDYPLDEYEEHDE